MFFHKCSVFDILHIFNLYLLATQNTIILTLLGIKVLEKIQISKWIMTLRVCDAAEGIVAIKKKEEKRRRKKRKAKMNGKGRKA